MQNRFSISIIKKKKINFSQRHYWVKGWAVRTLKKAAVPKELIKGNRLISHPTRFTICFLLFLHSRIGFAELQRFLGLTPGNLDSHLEKLNEASYIEVRKVFTLFGPRTAVQITPIGRQVFRNHAVKLRKMLEKIS